MGVIDMIRGRNDSRHVAAMAETGADAEKTDPIHSASSSDIDNLSLEARQEKEIELRPNEVTPQAPDGVKQVEAAALVWSKTTVYCVYAWIWVCFFMLALQQSIGSNVINYAYSDFSAAPQISTAGILASIIGGVIKLPIAKVLNIWGRCEAMLVFTAVYLVGIIIIAACSGPNGYAAGYTLYWIGYDAIYLILQVFIADVSGMRNRAFAFAFATTPFICTAFTGPLAAQSFLDTASWRWAWGAFAIIQVPVYVPLALVFKLYQRKAEKMGLYTRPASGRTWYQSLAHYFHEFDIVGCFLLMAAFVLFLLPFSLASYGRTEYHTATFIAEVVIGFCLFFVFAAWEKWFARVHFIRYELLRERTILGACCLSAILYFSFYSWDLYYYNFVTVVYNLTVSEAGYMSQIYNVGSCFWSVVFGAWIRAIKQFKYTCLFFGLPLMFLGAGLSIHFRSADQGIGYVVMCQIFIAFAGGTLVIGEDMAVMAAADKEGVPMMLSLIGLCANLGGAIGYAVSAAIYTNTFPDALRKALPSSMKDQWSTIYLGGVTTQSTYTVGSDVRNAIDYAWGESQRYGAISATCVLVLAIPAIAVWKNYRVTKKQNKGLVL